MIFFPLPGKLPVVMIMNMQRPQRVYVKLLAEISPYGQTRPLTITLPDGRFYRMDRVVVEEAANPTSSGPTTATRYEVIVKNQLRPLWREYETGRWFVEIPRT